MPFQKSLYPANWKQISLARREQAGWKCEWCGVAQGEERLSARGKPYRIVLTVAHTTQDGGDKHDKANLKGLRALCQPCHLRYDHADHVRHAKETRRRKALAVQPELDFAGRGNINDHPI